MTATRDLRRLSVAARNILVDVLYPKTCPGCGMRGMWLCDQCTTTLPLLLQHICDACGSPTHEPYGCRAKGPAVARARAAYPYAGWAGAGIRRFKYGNEPARAEHLAARMMPVMAEFGAIDIIVPVPLHPKKLELRGYNQSELLAGHIAAWAGLSMRSLLIRTRATLPQVTLDRQRRHDNVMDAFALDPGWATEAGRNFLLIDDVRTTGATTNACALVLKDEARAASVSVLTFAQELSQTELERWVESLIGSPVP